MVAQLNRQTSEVQTLQARNREIAFVELPAAEREMENNPLAMIMGGNEVESLETELAGNISRLAEEFDEDDAFGTGEGGGLGGGANGSGGLGGGSAAGGLGGGATSAGGLQPGSAGGMGSSQPAPTKDPFVVDTTGDGQVTLLGDEAGKVKINDGSGEVEVNKWEDDMLFADKNNDGQFQADEIQSTKDPEAIKKSGYDKNNDGKLDEDEAKAGNLKFVSFDKSGKEQVRGFGEEGPGGKPAIKSFGYEFNSGAQNGTAGVIEKGRGTAEFANGKKAQTINFDFA
jgi:hypothetical protein